MMNFRSVACVLLFLLMVPAIARAEPQRHTVVIEDMKYKPAEIQIKPGDTVVWVNRDDREHVIVANDGSFRSGRLGSGRTFSQKFDKPGSFPYHDDLYDRLRGTIVVKAAK